MKSVLMRKKIHLVASIMRRLALFSIGPEPFDMEPQSGMRVRLYPSTNSTDKITLTGRGATADQPFQAALSAAFDTGDSKSEFQFIDIGGNSGTYSIAMHLSAIARGVTAKCLIIEPNPVMAARLSFNLKASELDFVLVEAAVSNRTGSGHLDISGPNLGQAHLNEAGTSTISVPIRRLDDILDEFNINNIDLIKIDIEGHEVAALEPLMEGPKSRYPRFIFAEVVHDKNNKIQDLLLDNGYVQMWRRGADALFSLGRTA